MPGPYSPKSIANGLLQRAFNAKHPTSQLKLQKLSFLSHGYYLAFTDVPLINELFEAWDYGPVCRDLYQEFREFGREPITRLATDVDWDTSSVLPVPEPADDPVASKVMDYVTKTYGNVSPFALSELSHKEGWAWDRARKSDKFKLKNIDISNDYIKEDFLPFIKKKVA